MHSQTHHTPRIPTHTTTRSPARGDLVAAVGETWGEGSVRLMRDRMRADPEGRRILAERPRVTVRAPCMLRALCMLSCVGHAGFTRGWTVRQAAAAPPALSAVCLNSQPHPQCGLLISIQDASVARCWELPPGTFGAACLHACAAVR